MYDKTQLSICQKSRKQGQSFRLISSIVELHNGLVIQILFKYLDQSRFDSWIICASSYLKLARFEIVPYYFETIQFERNFNSWFNVHRQISSRSLGIRKCSGTISKGLSFPTRGNWVVELPKCIANFYKAKSSTIET